jgi:hypothetical protein
LKKISEERDAYRLCLRPFQIKTAAAGARRMARMFIGLELEEFAVPIVDASAAVPHHS